MQNGQADQAIKLFKELQDPNEVVLIVLFHACAQLGTEEALHLAKIVAEQMPKSFHLTNNLSNSLWDALIKCGDCSSAEILHSKMTRTVNSYTNLMDGFNKDNDPRKTLTLFNQMKNDGIEENKITYLCVIKALSRLGHFRLAHSIIQDMPKSFLSDDYIQTALIDLWVCKRDIRFSSIYF